LISFSQAANAQVTNQALQDTLKLQMASTESGVNTNIRTQAAALDQEVTYATQALVRVVYTLSARSAAASPMLELMEFTSKVIKGLASYRELSANITGEANLNEENRKTLEYVSQQASYTFMMLPKIERQSADCQARLGYFLNVYFQTEFAKIRAQLGQASGLFSEVAQAAQSRIRANFVKYEAAANACSVIPQLDQRRTCYLELVRVTATFEGFTSLFKQICFFQLDQVI
jgi:hypothetical protein